MNVKRGNTMPTASIVFGLAHRPNARMISVQLRYNFRLYPTPGQRQALAKAFGCARVVYNDGLRIRQEAHAAGGAGR